MTWLKSENRFVVSVHEGGTTFVLAFCCFLFRAHNLLPLSLSLYRYLPSILLSSSWSTCATTMHLSHAPLTCASPSTPPARPARYSDRFIPSRTGTDDLQTAFSLLRCSPARAPTPPSQTPSPTPQSAAPNSYSLLLKSELLETPPQTPPTSLLHEAAPPSLRACPHPAPQTPPPSERPVTLHPGLEGLKRLSSSSVVSSYPHVSQPTRPTPNIFHFQSPRTSLTSPSRNSTPPLCSPAAAPFHVGFRDSQRALLSCSSLPGARISRKIARAPFKVLDAPCLKDDFYLNLVDWSPTNVLAVGLGSCVYLWSACTSHVTKLCDLQFRGPVCSVAWNHGGSQLAVGTMLGLVQVWDVVSGKLLRTMTGHTERAACLAWNSTILSSGGRDMDIYNRDLRCKEAYIAKLSAHKQEVCGLKWSFDDGQLASGGNDNKLLVWNAAGAGCGGDNVGTGSGRNYIEPVLRFSYHEAAVKAIAWSPHARGLLASGGGTADRKLRFWNTVTNSALAVVDTGSQVCNLAWSKNVNEMVSTHGYSQNQIIVWKYPSLSKVVTLMGHSYRVLYLSMSPSGETIVTGAGDETLRFWNVFPTAKNVGGRCNSASVLFPGRMNIR